MNPAAEIAPAVMMDTVMPKRLLSFAPTNPPRQKQVMVMVKFSASCGAVQNAPKGAFKMDQP